MNFVRYVIASLMWQIQDAARLFGFYRVTGRQIDWLPVRCSDCGWIGPLRWTLHGYERYGYDDLAPVDYCPGCKSQRLWACGG